MRKLTLLITSILALGSLAVSCQKEAEKPYADFDYTIDGVSTSTAYLPCEVIFENKSSNATRYEWDFGDGGTSTETNPTHIYADSGTYVIVLKAIGENGESTSEQQLRLKWRNNKIRVGSVNVRTAKAAGSGKFYITVAGVKSDVRNTATGSFSLNNCVYSCSSTNVVLYKCKGNTPDPQTDTKVYSVDWSPWSYDTEGSRSNTVSIKWGNDVQFEATVYYSCFYQR